jgi:hypothetical protein
MVKTPSQARQDPEDLPHVEALDATPDNTENASSSSAPPAPQAERARLKRQMQEQAETIRILQEQLQHATNALNDSQHAQDEMNSLIQQTMTPGRRETPGPHRLQPKGLRQEDKDFQEKVRQQKPDDPTPLDPTDPGFMFIKNLAKAISDNHHHARPKRTHQIHRARPTLGRILLSTTLLFSR